MTGATAAPDDARLEALRREFECESGLNSDPALPTSRQVAADQAFINNSQAPLRFRLVVQRTAVELIGPDTAPNPPELEVLPPPVSPPLPPAVTTEGQVPLTTADRFDRPR